MVFLRNCKSSLRLCHRHGSPVYALLPLQKSLSHNQVQLTRRKLLLLKLTAGHSFHSTPTHCIPRGLRVPSTTKYGLDLHEAESRSDEQHEKQLTSKDDASLAGTYVVELESDSPVEYGQEQSESMHDRGRHGQVWDLEKEDFYDQFEPRWKHRESLDSPVEVKRYSSVGTERTRKSWSSKKRDSFDQQWVDGNHGNSMPSSGAARITMPKLAKVSNSFQFKKSEEWMINETNPRLARQEDRKWSKRRDSKGRLDDSRQHWVDKSWLTSNVADEYDGVRGDKVQRSSAANSSYTVSDDLPDVDAELSRREDRKWSKRRDLKSRMQNSQQQWVDNSWLAPNAADERDGGNLEHSSAANSSDTVSDDLLEVDAELASPRGISRRGDYKEQVISDDGEQHNFGEQGGKKGQQESSWRKQKRKQYDKKLGASQAIGPTPGNEILFGIAPCLLALQTAKRVVHRAFVSASFQQSDRTEAKSILAAIENQMEVEVVHRSVLDRLSGKRPHQGVCLETTPLEQFTLSDREDVVNAQLESLHQQQQEQQQQHPTLWLALDQVKDPMNFGAVLRSSYFLGVDRILTCVANSCPLSPVVSKASSGVMELLDVYAAYDVPLVLQSLSSLGWHVIGACSSTFAANQDTIPCVPCHQFTITKPTILVVGNEGYGLRSTVSSTCSEFLTIEPGRELHPGIDSLNVSVATGILLHSLLGKK